MMEKESMIKTTDNSLTSKVLTEFLLLLGWKRGQDATQVMFYDVLQPVYCNCIFPPEGGAPISKLLLLQD